MDQYLNKTGKKRYHLLDSIRGICVLGMVFYHTLFDIAVLGGAGYDASFLKIFDFVRDLGAALFIFLSGLCFHFGTRRLRRFVVLFSAGIIVSVVTHFALPEATVIFGILTFMSISGVIMIPLSKMLKKVPAITGCVISLVVFVCLFHMNFGYLGTYKNVVLILPKQLYQNYFTAFLGFPFEGFSSGDYYPLLPWFFVYMAGFFFYGILQKHPVSEKYLCFRIPILHRIGQYSLPVYLIHQPVIFGIVSLIVDLFLYKN